jgi:hypothetical protein
VCGNQEGKALGIISMIQPSEAKTKALGRFMDGVWREIATVRV